MTSLFNDISVIHEQNAVRIADCGKPVRDDKGRSSLHERRHCLTDFRFGARVYAGGCFVENQNRRIAKKHSRDGQKLPLSD